MARQSVNILRLNLNKFLLNLLVKKGVGLTKDHTLLLCFILKWLTLKLQKYVQLHKPTC